MGVFNPDDNKVYVVPVQTCYQFTQEIENFSDLYGNEDDNEAMKNMNYMSKKLELVNAFGTKKSIKKVTSMLTNMVEDGGITNVGNKGVRDHRLTDMANSIAKDQEGLKKEILTSVQRRMTLYSKEALLP